LLTRYLRRDRLEVTNARLATFWIPERTRYEEIMKEWFPQWYRINPWDLAPPANKETGLLLNLAILDWPELADKYLGSPSFKDLPRSQKTKIWTEEFKLRDRESETLLGYCLRERQLNFLSLFARYGASFDLESEALYTAMGAFQNCDTTGTKTLKALELLLRAGSDPDAQGRQSERRGFAFTPLQLAVYKLEYEWVEFLLDEDASVNKLGRPGGKIPSSFDDPDEQSDEFSALRKMGQQSPLEICAYTEPTWTKSTRVDTVRGTRRNIEELLKRHGAEKPTEEEDEDEDEDEMEVDVTTPPEGTGNHELIDLTREDNPGRPSNRTTTLESLTAAQANPNLSGR
jgi:hypothetical protein